MDQPKSPPPVDPMKHFAKNCAFVKLLALQIVHGKGNALSLVVRAAGSLITLAVAVSISKGWL